MRNKKVLFILLFIVIILTVPFVINYFKNIEIEEFKHKTIVNIVDQTQLHLQTLIKEKQNTTATIGLGLSTNDSIVNALRKKDAKGVNLKAYSLQLRQSSDFKNVWFQLITKDGISLQRSWTNIYGDRISDYRIDLQDVLEYPRILNSISVGRFDMTFKSIVPIYDQNKEFLGVVEVITHFNSIAKKLKKKGTSAIILADKRYKEQLINPFTKKFIDKYYIANFDADDKLSIYLKNYGVEKYINRIDDKRYFIDDTLDKIVSYYYINDLKGNKMGHFLLFIDQRELDIVKIGEITYIYNLYIMLFVVSALIFGYFIYSGLIKSAEINYSFSRNLFVSILIAYMILALISTKLIDVKYDSDIELYKKQFQNKTLLEFEAIKAKNRGVSELVFLNKINNDKVKSLIQEGKREELYRYFLPTYKDLKIKYNVRQVHFHLKDSVSFLRMHRSSKYGDSLKGVRESIDFVQKHLSSFEGFEEGRIYNGYRYLFPLHIKDELIGSVEISFDVYSIMDSYFKLFNVDRMNFLLSKEVIDQKVFKDEKSNYTKSFVDGFYLDKLVIEKLDRVNKKIISNNIDPKKLKLMAKRIKEGRAFVIYFDEINEVTTVIPLINKLSTQVTGAIKISKNDKHIQRILTEKRQVSISLLIILAFIMIFIYREIIIKHKIRAEFNKNQKILDSQHSFIIITDGAEIKASNTSMLEFLGYESLEEFKEENNCICEFFEYEQGKDYILEDMGGINWFEYIKANPKKHNIAKISDKKDREHLFYIEFDENSMIDAKNFIVTFIDITKLKNMEGQLIQSEKMASLGKMIGNIAHQWRQPLSVISVAASGMKFKDEFGKLEKNELHTSLDQIVANAKYLSETIDTFRDIVKEERTVKELEIQDILDRVIAILSISLNNKNIELIQNIDYETKMIKFMVVGELGQVLTNIINNAVDVLDHRNIENPKIKIDCFKDKNNYIIGIEDNGGGVSEDIINNIFEPYFTTKHQSQGTGLGLYMSHKIVEESLGGKLYVKNTDNGAKFIIEISSN